MFRCKRLFCCFNDSYTIGKCITNSTGYKTYASMTEQITLNQLIDHVATRKSVICKEPRIMCADCCYSIGKSPLLHKKIFIFKIVVVVYNTHNYC